MPGASRYVVIGAGQAGGWAARTLREQDPGARIVLIGEERHPPYERPPLSKDVLLGLKPADSTYILPREKLDALGIAWRCARVSAIDTSARRVVTTDGKEVAYDRALLAVGSRVRRLTVPGAGLDGVHYVRSIEDSLDLSRRLDAEAHVLVVGGGWIGLEVASAARRRGARVTLVELADRLCGRVLPDGVVCRYLLDLQRRNGVHVRLDTAVTAFGGARAVTHAVLSTGEEIPVTVAVIGVGVVPDVELTQRVGIETADGIVVDACGRTSAPDVFAAGDCTIQPNDFVGRRLRLESWANAQNQAIAAAKAMAGKPVPYQEIPWFWSDQHGVNVQLLGLPEPGAQVVTRGDSARDRFMQFYLADCRIVAAVAVNSPRELRAARRLMQAGTRASPERLADPAIELSQVA